MRVLIVIYGCEPAGWAAEVGRVVSMLSNPIVRVLAFIDFAFPPFTSLTPFARRVYSDAIAYWKEQQEAGVHAVIDEIRLSLAEPVELVWLRRAKGHLRDVIADHVMTWSADAVIVAAPVSRFRSWLSFGPVPNHLLRGTKCALIVTGCSSNLSR